MNASEEAARRLGFAPSDPYVEALTDVEDVLSRETWSADDRRAARAALKRIRDLDDEHEEPPAPEYRDATASEIAGAHMLGGKRAARELRDRGVEKGDGDA